MNEQDLISEATFRNYAYNRKINPDISPERWEKVYGDTKELEKRYQENKENFETLFVKLEDSDEQD